MIEPYVCDNLNQIYRFFSFLLKKRSMSFRDVIENRLESSLFKENCYCGTSIAKGEEYYHTDYLK